MPRPRPPRFAAAAALLCTALASCAGGPSFDGSVFHGRGVSFRIAPVPAGWRRVDLPAADLAFRDDANEGSVLVNSRCHASDRDAPLVSLTDTLLIGTTGRVVALEETVPFDAREARHTALVAKLDGVPMAYDIYVLKKDGCVFDFVYVTPASTASTASPAGKAAPRGAAAFEAFALGFHTLATAKDEGAR